MFTKESVQEDLANEMKKMDEEIKEKDLVIEKLNQNIKNTKEIDSVKKCIDTDPVKESTIYERIEDLKNVCDKCNFKGKSENNLKVHLSNEHKFVRTLCEY